MTVSARGGWRSPPGWIRVGTYVVATAIVLVLVLIGVVIAAAPRIGFPTHRHHLTAIRIDHGACPGVEAMHFAAMVLRDAYHPLPGGSLDAYGHPRRWPEVRESLARFSVELRNAIDISTPSLPRRVQHYLAITRRSLDAGQRELLLAKNGLDFFVRTIRLESEGQQAFGYASDLVGDECVVPLGS